MSENRQSFITSMIGMLLAGLFLMSFVVGFAQTQSKTTMNEDQILDKYKFASPHYEKGKKYFTKNNLKGAEKELIKCLEIMPKFSEAHFLMANIHYKNNELDKAMASINEAFASIQFAQIYEEKRHQVYLNSLREKKARLEERIEQLSTVKDSSDGPNSVNSVKESMLREINDISQKLIEPPTKSNEAPAKYHYFLGNIHFKQKQYQEAHKDFLKAIEIDPVYGDAYNNLANLYYMSKNYEKALEFLKKAKENGVSVNPKFEEAILKSLNK
jgi:pentatricopeptide repeat protein